MDLPSRVSRLQRPNSAIMTDVDTGQEPLPTLNELDSLPPSKANRLIALIIFWPRLVTPPNGEFISDVLMRFHLNPRLAEPIPSSHDVFLVVRSRDTVEPPIGSLKHWSFYCQGHFYHLSARGLRRDCVEKSQNTSKSQGVSCQLTHEDWNNLDQGTFKSISEAERQRPLVAFKVGQTDYRPDQILRLASWVIEQLPRYNLFDANCQHFVNSMVGRTVMRLCDRTVFMGSKTQIVEWSLKKGDQCQVNSADGGWIIAPPLPSRCHITYLAYTYTKVFS